ncbi:hypothetical protein [Rhizobium sp. SSA_523]|uniref:hypothetical protein n=1 Tax=Rhizobium sp. SSA_523 TaxID=2952477 RepID=UPI00209031C1|nr:hypothetical protein [Rhizobium sp. SSA_523]MCO5730624.1 hypothetical protein [Rhizobium sp. SSA_523]WKC24545.1 hypothetical protein QTJ18_10870 [Rhizobium sp. SSA_523]
MSEIIDLDHVRLTDRPLVVCDVDDVVLEFMMPFEQFLVSLGHRLEPRSYRLHGNILSTIDQQPLADTLVSQLVLDFFEAQEQWQTPFGDAVSSLKSLGAEADVVFLTAMPPRYTQMRRRLLDQLELTFPLLATETPKGPVIRRMHGERDLPLAFIDDMVHNHVSVGDSMPNCLLVHLMPQREIHKHAPKPGPHVVQVTDWRNAEDKVRAHFNQALDRQGSGSGAD